MSWLCHLIFHTIFIGFALSQDVLPRIVCYLSSSSYLQGFSFENINSTPCTHVIYSHAVLDPKRGVVINEADKDGIYDMMRFRSRTNNRFNAMLMVGNESDSDSFAQLTSDKSMRRVLIDSLVQLRNEYDFDGFDLHWKYPGITVRIEKKNYLSLAQELRAEFNKVYPQRRILISMILPNNKDFIRPGFNLLVLNSLVDFMSIPAYDFPSSEHHSSLNTSNVANKDFTADFITRLTLRLGGVAQRLLLGLPLFGRIVNETDYTTLIPYNQICQLLTDNEWIKSGDPFSTGPLIEKGDQIISYDNETSIMAKLEMVKDGRLGGVMFWRMEMDDWNLSCPQGVSTMENTRWPLIQTARDYLDEFRSYWPPTRSGENQLVNEPEPTPPFLDSQSFSQSNNERNETLEAEPPGSATPFPVFSNYPRPTVDSLKPNNIGPVSVQPVVYGNSGQVQGYGYRPPNSEPSSIIIEADSGILIEQLTIQYNTNFFHAPKSNNGQRN